MTPSSSNEGLPSSADIGAAVSRSGAAADQAGKTLVLPTESASSAAPERSAPASAEVRRWRWLTAAFLLAGAAQLITISALVSADPLAASWWALLLAVAPAPLTAIAAFAPATVARPATVLAAAALVVGIIGGLLHIGLFFVPALAALAAGGVRLWRGEP
jgi:hypothetical protein